MSLYRQAKLAVAIAIVSVAAACGGVYEVDADDAIQKSRTAFREELDLQRQAIETLVLRIEAILADRTVYLDTRGLEYLYWQLKDDARCLRLEIETGDPCPSPRTAPPEPPAVEQAR